MKPLIVFTLLGLAGGSAFAQPDVKRLAQFDLGFAKCEARFAHMKGHRDEAYLALWKVRADAGQRAALDKQRKSAKYQQERALAQKAMSQDTSPAMAEKIRNQCDATWSELQRNRAPAAVPAPARPPASAPKAAPNTAPKAPQK